MTGLHVTGSYSLVFVMRYFSTIHQKGRSLLISRNRNQYLGPSQRDERLMIVSSLWFSIALQSSRAHRFQILCFNISQLHSSPFTFVWYWQHKTRLLFVFPNIFWFSWRSRFMFWSTDGQKKTENKGFSASRKAGAAHFSPKTMEEESFGNGEASSDVRFMGRCNQVLHNQKLSNGLRFLSLSITRQDFGSKRTCHQESRTTCFCFMGMKSHWNFGSHLA